MSEADNIIVCLGCEFHKSLADAAKQKAALPPGAPATSFEIKCDADPAGRSFHRIAHEDDCPKNFFKQPDIVKQRQAAKALAQNREVESAIADDPPLLAIFKSITGPIRSRIGRALWDRAFIFFSSPRDADEIREFMAGWERRLSLLKICGCADVYNDFKRVNPPPDFAQTAGTWFIWFWGLKNAVNQKRGKPLFPLDKAIEKYSHSIL